MTDEKKIIQSPARRGILKYGAALSVSLPFIRSVKAAPTEINMGG